MDSIELLNVLVPFKNYTGHSCESVAVSIEIPKNKSTIIFYDVMGNEVTEMVSDFRWSLWLNPDIGIDPKLFSAIVYEVYDVPGESNYLVNIYLHDFVSMDILAEFNVTKDWSELIYPWKKAQKYSYRSY